MTLTLSQLSHTRMDLELLNYINVDMKWNIMRKGRTSMTRRPRKPGAGSFELVYNIHEPAASESKKVVDGSSKKRRFLHQSTSPCSKTQCVKGEEGLSPGPHTPSVHHEDSGQRCWSSSLSKIQKTKSKSGLKNSKTKKTKKDALNLVDFSGIALLADVACSIFIQEAKLSIPKGHTTLEVKLVNTCSVDIKEGIVSPGSNGSVVQQTVDDIGKAVEEKKVVSSIGLRLHWDLNTVMDEWEAPCDDLQIESVKHDDASTSVPFIESCNVDSSQDLELAGTKMVTVKMSDGESSASKSEVVDSLNHPAKSDDLFTSPTSVLKEQTVVKCETDTIDGLKLDHQPVSEEVIQGFCDKKVNTEDHVIESCSSNATQGEHGHMAEGEDDRIQVGYDSPFEDGELREPIETPEKETVRKQSDNIYADEFCTIENPLSGNVDHGQTMDNQHLLLVKEAAPNNEIEQGVQVDTFEGPYTDEPEKDICERKESHIDESTSFDVCRNDEYLHHQSRSSNIGDSTMREYDLKSRRSLDRNYSRNYNSRGGGYRTQDRRPSPSERNNSYGSYRGPPPARSHSRDRYRYHDPKPHFTPNFTRPGAQSRSRSGSPIAWHFQKRKNLDTSSSGEIKTGTRGGHVSPERSSKCFDDHRRFKDGQFRDKRQAYEPTGYPERLKSDDYSRFNQRSARFSQISGYKYKDNSDDIRKHDGYYEKVNRVGRPVDDGARRFSYAHNRE